MTGGALSLPHAPPAMDPGPDREPERESYDAETPDTSALSVERLQALVSGLRYRFAAEIANDPEAMAAPRAVVPKLAYAGRLTLLAAPRKAGKSTLVGVSVASVTAERPLFGEAVPAPMVLWAALDEPEGDLVRRLKVHGADLARVLVVTPPATTAKLVAAAQLFSVDLLIVDTISDLAAGEVESENDNLQVKNLLAPLRGLARELGTAVVLLHHATKSTGQARGAGAFEDVADHIVTLAEDPDDETVRKVHIRGRIAVDSFRFRWTDEGLEIPEREASTITLVRAFVWGHPGCASKDIQAAVSRRKEEVVQAIARLQSSGEIEDRNGGQKGRSRAWYVIEPRTSSGTSSKQHGVPARELPRNRVGTSSELDRSSGRFRPPYKEGAGNLPPGDGAGGTA